MRSVASALLLGATIVLAQDGTNRPTEDGDDFSNRGNFGAPFPEITYPESISQNPVTQAGSKSHQNSPPKYPSPWTEGLADWDTAYAQARDFVSQLTLEEKVNLTTGTGWQVDRCVGQTGSIPRLGFRAMCLQDSPLGIRFADFVSAFPAGVNVAAAWDRGLAYLQGAAMGSEHKGKGVDYQLGPVAGPLGRQPEGGRNWEGYSPDPVLTGQMFAETIKGIQSQNVMTNLKHFIGNEQEHFRQMPESNGFGYNISEPASSNIDDETMHELYLWPFADGIRAGAASIMCSYQQVNSSQGCQNSYTLNYLLKGELGFQGPVISDWLATHSGVSSVLAGLDMTMPGDTSSFNDGYSYFGANLTIAVLNGTVPAWRIDDMAMRIMAAYYKVDVDANRTDINFHSWTKDTYNFEQFYVKKGWQKVNDHVNVRADHAALIRHVGAASTVLLKNTNKTLPLAGDEVLTTVFGADAGPNPRGPNGCPDRGCNDGTLAMSWGSGTAEFPYLVTPDTAIQREVLAKGGSYESSFDNYDLDTIGPLARRSNVSIVFANSNAGEGFIQVDGNVGDRNNLTLWGGADELVKTVTSECSNTILVIHSVGPVLLEEYKNNPNITAILWAGVPGQESGNAIADVLYGHVNPGAKLPWTIGKNRTDYGTDILYNDNDEGGIPQLNFKEGKIIDYRNFDLHNKTPTYEFGFGLSYTTFSYSDLEIENLNASAYVPFTGYTPKAPTFGNFSMNPSDHTFPSNFTDRVPLYHYPWINSTNLTESYGGPNYGSNDFVPAGSQNGSAQPIPKAGGAPGGNPSLYDVLFRVYATITNTGSVPGQEVPQLYVSRGGPHDPVRELRGFEKLSIAPNATARVSFDITRRDLAGWNTVEQDWVVRNTTKKVWVGSSSRDLPLSGVLA
ncbi:hypothetical protein Q7P37_005807 [Cladosporium fusiforme]